MPGPVAPTVQLRLHVFEEPKPGAAYLPSLEATSMPKYQFHFAGSGVDEDRGIRVEDVGLVVDVVTPGALPLPRDSPSTGDILDIFAAGGKGGSVLV